MKRLASEQVWPTVEELRSTDDAPSWRHLGWVMETTEGTLRNAYSRWWNQRDKT